MPKHVSQELPPSRFERTFTLVRQRGPNDTLLVFYRITPASGPDGGWQMFKNAQPMYDGLVLGNLFECIGILDQIADDPCGRTTLIETTRLPDKVDLGPPRIHSVRALPPAATASEATGQRTVEEEAIEKGMEVAPKRALPYKVTRREEELV